MGEKYSKWSLYNYVLGNPIKLIDRDGLDVYLFFYRMHNLIRIMDDNGTPDDFSDDIFIDEFPAHNNTVRPRQSWPDGIYPMQDRRRTRRHGNISDTPNGAYGANGIYRAMPFTQSNGMYRSGMGVHSGRENRPFAQRLTEGCIRTTPDCMNAIERAIINFGDLTRIILNSNVNPYQEQFPEATPEPTPEPPQEPRPIIPPLPPLPPIPPNPQPMPIPDRV